MSGHVPELVLSFVAGDEADFAALVRMFRRKVYLTAHKIVGNHLDADEVVQETFVRVYRRRNELARVKYFSTFLMRVATNYAIDLLRRRKMYRDYDEYSGHLPAAVQLVQSKRVNAPDEDYENKKIMEDIQNALDRLPPRQKLTAILHDIDGHTKAEIAVLLECPEATVRSNLHIARTKLKRMLKHRL